MTAIVREYEMEPVLVETGPLHGDDEFADALGARLRGPRRLPADAGSDDLIAAIASCAAFIGSSLHGNIVAAAFDRTWLMLDLVEQAKRRGVAALFDAEDRVVPDAAGIGDAFRAAAAQGSLAPRVAHLQERIDGAFDRLAELATSATARTHPPRVERSTTDVRLLPDAADARRGRAVALRRRA